MRKKIMGVLDKETMKSRKFLEAKYGIYRRRFCIVYYKDQSFLEFNLENWLLLRDGIIKNMVDKKLARVELIQDEDSKTQ